MSSTDNHSMNNKAGEGRTICKGERKDDNRHVLVSLIYTDSSHSRIVRSSVLPSQSNLASSSVCQYMIRIAWLCYLSILGVLVVDVVGAIFQSDKGLRKIIFLVQRIQAFRVRSLYLPEVSNSRTMPTTNPFCQN